MASDAGKTSAVAGTADCSPESAPLANESPAANDERASGPPSAADADIFKRKFKYSQEHSFEIAVRRRVQRFRSHL